MKTIFKKICLLGGKSFFRLKTRIRRSSAVLSSNASECFLDRLPPSAFAGALAASFVWVVVVLGWGL